MTYRSKTLLTAACAALSLQPITAQAQSQRNVILFLFVPLRMALVSHETAPI